MSEPTVEERIAAQEAAAEAEWLDGWLTGPTRTRWTSLPVQVGDLAPDLELLDSTGARRRLSEAWAEGTVLLIFLRHFGCSCLRDRWDGLATELDSYRGAGASVQLVCQGEPERTSALAERRGYPRPVWCDPTLAAYRAYGLLQGTPAQLLHDFAWHPGDEALAEEVGRTSRRGTERMLVDDPWQLPGEFVIGRDGRIALAHRYQSCEDVPASGVLLGAIAAVVA